ncbi:DUF6456 domain-containing protein [Zhengella sp. ZM62]|uniref:DUF6456 domain-containing protein n=1 Tax=Zhengella sedimenti TaxID=3390035 RepID=UPI003976D42E
MKPDDAERHLLRLLGRLRQGPQTFTPAAMPDRVTLPGPSGGSLCFRRATLEEACRRGFVESSDGTRLRLTGKGREKLDGGFRQAATAMPAGSAPVRRVLSNPAESPLALLARRRGKDGKPYLRPEEVEAGERLRCDCEKARLRPRLGASWDANAASLRGSGSRGGLDDLTAAALDARRRVAAALDAAGPDLSGLMLDVCCFLKGLEQVEMERQWPRRSAKLVLKTGLSLLARHYGIGTDEGRGAARSILHWGTDDYRPELESDSG